MPKLTAGRINRASTMTNVSRSLVERSQNTPVTVVDAPSSPRLRTRGGMSFGLASRDR